MNADERRLKEQKENSDVVKTVFTSSPYRVVSSSLFQSACICVHLRLNRLRPARREADREIEREDQANEHEDAGPGLVFFFGVGAGRVGVDLNSERGERPAQIRLEEAAAERG